MHYPLPYRLVLSLVEVGHSRFLVVLLAILVIAADGKSDSLDLPHSRVSHLTNHKCELARLASDQCTFVRKHCAEYEAGLLPYLHFYYCTFPSAQPLAAITLVVWLAILFTTIGTAASDYFTPNLNSIASILGMSESMAGVTFLAFGNGSPDVFSTFISMRTNSGGLAIGELIGAAGFISSVVAGSMALIRPFSVPKYSFMRDVGFFVLASCFSMVFLSDGLLRLWECLVMIALYVAYVMVVMFSHWSEYRHREREDRDLQSRGHFSSGGESDDRILLEGDRAKSVGAHDGHDFRLIVDEDNASTADQVHTIRRSSTDLLRDDLFSSNTRHHPRLREFSGTEVLPVHPIRPSLVGALEFHAISWSLVRSRSQSSLSSGSLNWAHVSSENERENDVGDGSSTSLHPTRARSLRAPSVARLEQAPSAPEDLEHRKRAHSANSPVSPSFASQTSPAELVTPTSAAGLQAEPSHYHRHLQVPSIVLTDHEENHALPSSPVARGNDQAQQFIDVMNRSREEEETFPNVPRAAWESVPSVEARGRMKRDHPTDRLDHTERRTRSHSSDAEPFPPYHDDPELQTSVVQASEHQELRTPLLGESGPMHQQVATSGPFSKPRWWPNRYLPPPMILCLTLFPTFTYWRRKNFAGKILAVVTAPSVFLLTITLPVVDVDDTHEMALQEFYEDKIQQAEPANHSRYSDGILSITEATYNGPDLSRSGSIDPRSNHEGIGYPLDARHPLDSTSAQSQHSLDNSNQIPQERPQRRRWLTILQLFTAPWFVSFVMWLNTASAGAFTDLLVWILSATIFGLLAVAVSCFRYQNPRSWPPRSFLCLIGFVVSVAWISTIAGEVVGVLKAIGVVFGISEALLGLTIFAIGNSFGDLVANTTIAKLGFPVMALSACFGGPLLNILMGIGLGGLYMTIRSNRGEVYAIELDRTLFISGITLVGTLAVLLIAVPLNGWVMDRKIGWGLVALWLICTTVNVVINFGGIAVSST